MKLRYHPKARAAMHMGEAERQGRGATLQELVHVVEQRIRRFPRSAPRWQRLRTPLEVRRAVVRKTPYLVIYILDQNQLVIVALAHVRKAPGYWGDRLTEFGHHV